jgi:hypothetical protein
MVHDKIIYGLICTYNAFIFMKRQNPGILYISRMISNNSTSPTIMKLLYFFSYLCARDPLPYPETNNEGVEIHLTKALKDTSAAPKIPNPEIPPSANVSRNLSVSPLLRRSPRGHSAQDYLAVSTTSMYLDHGKGFISAAKAGEEP